jgi:LCP family protein required for cell wall assembly
VAAFLSFVWPGLGEWYAGYRRRALLFALPVLAVAVVFGLQLLGGAANLAIGLLTPSTALTVVILVGLLGAWRLISMTGALTTAGRRGSWRRPVPLATFAVLALAVVVVHAAAASLAWSFYRAGSEIFVADVGPDSTPQPSASGVAGGFVATPATEPETKQSRINFLLTGIDSSERRTHALTDTLLVVSVDPVSGEVSMVSFPRDIARFRLSNGKIFRGKINSLMTYAQNHPDEYPDGGLPTLVKELGHLLGVPIHYYAAVDLAGFSKMIDRVDGVTIKNDTAINDPNYGGWTDGRPIGFRLSKGTHTLDGQTALAYVRSRKTLGDTDFGRARRQQQLLVALQHKLTDPAMIPNLPGILKDAEGTVKTNFPSDRLSDMLAIGQSLDDKNIRRVVLGPPYAKNPPASESGGVYMLKLEMDRLAALSIELFGNDSSYASAGGPANQVSQ